MAAVPWPETDKRAFLQEQFETQERQYRTNYPTARFDVIEYAGEPIGRLYVHESIDDIRIMEVGLLAQWRNRGIGRILLSELIGVSEAKELPLSLHVESTNPARRVYLRLGFEAIEERGVHVYMRRRPTGDCANAS